VLAMLAGLGLVVFHLLDEMWTSGVVKGVFTIVCGLVAGLSFVGFALLIAGVAAGADGFCCFGPVYDHGIAAIVFSAFTVASAIVSAILTSGGCCSCFSANT
jgi:hypothetical protein